jgi:hypothetical protein
MGALRNPASHPGHFANSGVLRPSLPHSPGLTAGIVVLHAVEQHRPFQSGLIAERHVRVLIGDFEKHFSDGPPISLGEPGKFPDDFSCAHARNLVADRAIVIRQIHSEQDEQESQDQIPMKGAIRVPILIIL